MDSGIDGKHSWIIDCNPGVQDIITLLYLFSPKSDLDIKAITIEHGRNDIEIAAKNINQLLGDLGKECPIYKGSPDPIVQQKIVVSPTDLDNKEFEPLRNESKSKAENIQEIHAAEGIVKVATENPGTINILCLGPLTNLALAYHLDPKLKEKINRIILLGGALHQTGNLSKSGEYNFASDPHAASLVITAFGDKCTLVPLEVSNKCILDEAEIESITGTSNFVTTYLSKNALIQQKGTIFPSLSAAFLAVNNDLIKDKMTTKCQVESQSKECLGQLLILWPINHYYPKVHADELQKMNVLTIVKDLDHKKALSSLTECLLSY